MLRARMSWPWAGGVLVLALVLGAAGAEKPAPEAPARGKKTNRLAREISPYLLQHAHNPVDWFPWGDEAFFKALRQAKGAICSTASIAGTQGSGSSIPYAASKAGVINLTRSLARALAPDIRVNAVAPGFVDSPWNKDWPADRKEASVERTPLKRACTPQDIADVAFFLLTGAGMVTGQTIICDGGLTL